MLQLMIGLIPLVFLACAVRADDDKPNEGTALFAGGCFWCMEGPFEQIPGVIDVTSGYTGGEAADPTYEAVTTGTTGHAEAVRVTYDKRKVSYEDLLAVFWRQIDPTDAGGQFADRGSQYRTAIFYVDEAQKKAALASLDALQRSGKFDAPIATSVAPAGPFYPAEAYHQDFHRKNPERYTSYHKASGREGYLRGVWRVDDTPMTCTPAAMRRVKEKLSPLQRAVTQENATEPPFDNEHWNNKAPGIYVEVVSGEPLFSSRDKFDSGTGWPSFSRPLVPGNIVSKKDFSHGMVRTEVRSRQGDSHLGHLFDDGPAPTRQRYCINSAALRFIPKERLVEEGYGAYLGLFE